MLLAKQWKGITLPNSRRTLAFCYATSAILNLKFFKTMCKRHNCHTEFPKWPSSISHFSFKEFWVGLNERSTPQRPLKLQCVLMRNVVIYSLQKEESVKNDMTGMLRTGRSGANKLSSASSSHWFICLAWGNEYTHYSPPPGRTAMHLLRKSMPLSIHLPAMSKWSGLMCLNFFFIFLSWSKHVTTVLLKTKRYQ